METRTYRYSYIPSYILTPFSEDGETLRVIDTEQKSVSSSPLDDVFLEDFILRGERERLDRTDVFKRKTMKEDMAELTQGKTERMSEMASSAREFVLTLFYSGRFSSFRFMEYLVNNKERMKEKEKEEDFINDLTSSVFASRDTDYLLRSRETEYLSLPYIEDLEAVLLESPHSPLILGSNPLFLFNPFNRDAEKDICYPYHAWGTVFILPVSPSYALCLYDSYIYRIKKKGGRYIMSEEDTARINSAMLLRSGKCVYNPGSGKDGEYYLSLLSSLEKDRKVDMTPSIFLIRERALGKEGEGMREYDSKLLKYDLDHGVFSGRRLKPDEENARLFYIDALLDESYNSSHM